MKNLLLLLLFLCFSSHAGQYYFQLENDIVFGEDGNYSNGLIIGWESDPELDNQLGSLLGQWQNKALYTQDNADKAWGLKISQRMWTPSEIKIVEAQPSDRPYAGFLEIEHHTASYSSNLAQKNWLSLGIIGPSSGTEQLQGFIHDLLDSSTPEGWSHQIQNELTFQIGYEVDYLLLRQPAYFNSEWEISSFSHTTLGNLRSDVDIGLTFRWGASLANTFGRLSNHFAHTGNTLSVTQARSLFFYTRMAVGYRFNDLTFDGDLPYNSLVEFKKQRATAVIGATYSYSDVSVTWSYNFYNKEYLTDQKTWHGYGLLQFSWLT